ncbi:MAG: nucleotidyltransferase family protein [Holophagaceae bacterium]|nr:nucleotidyltransferase family protein [Holophagaceae bacterium]
MATIHERHPPSGLAAALRPEARLLLLCARLAIGPEERAEILGLLGADLDWDYLRGLASRHALFPLLHRNLDAIAPSSIPRPFFVELWAHHEKLRLRNAAMAAELLETLRLLDAHGIPAIPFKGPALAAAVYGDLALRWFRDLDILIRPQDLQAAKELLKTRGYRPDHELDPTLEAAFLRSKAAHHLVMASSDDALLVELHWKTDADHPLEEAADSAWWARLGETDLGEGRVRCFAPRELLLILCLHGSKHHWSSLAWLVDVAELIRQQPGMDWDWVLSRAGEMRSLRRLALGLCLARQLLDAPLPDDVIQRAQTTPRVEALAARISRMIFDPEAVELGPLQRLRLDLSLCERLGQQLSHLFNLLLNPSLEEWSRWPLPRHLFFLYAPLRLFTLMERNLWGRGRGK